MRVLVPAPFLVLLLTAVAAAEEWRCARGNPRNTGVVANHGPVSKPRVIWKREEKDTISPGVALASGKLVYGVGEFALACRMQTSGLDLWEGEVKQQVRAWPAIAGERAYVGSPDGVHYIFNLDTGEEVGGTEADDAIVADPAVSGDYYVAGGTDGLLYVMSPKNGKVLWKPRTGPVRLGAALDKGRAYAVSEEGALYAFDLKRQRELWRYEAKARPLSAPILGKGVVWLTLKDAVQGVRTKRGAAGPRRKTRGIVAGPALDGSLLYYGTDSGEVVVLDLKQGKELRRVRVAGEAVSTPLILARKILYGAAGKTLFAVEPKTGKLLWTFEGEEKFAPPIVADKAIYAAAGRTFFCLR